MDIFDAAESAYKWDRSLDHWFAISARTWSRSELFIDEAWRLMDSALIPNE